MTSIFPKFDVGDNAASFGNFHNTDWSLSNLVIGPKLSKHRQCAEISILTLSSFHLIFISQHSSFALWLFGSGASFILIIPTRTRLLASIHTTSALSLDNIFFLSEHDALLQYLLLFAQYAFICANSCDSQIFVFSITPLIAPDSSGLWPRFIALSH